MSKSIKQTIIIGLLITNLIIMIVLGITTKNQMQHMSSEVTELRQEMYHNQQQTIEKMTNQFQSILLDSQNKVENFTTTITKITPNEQTAELKIDFELREVNEPDHVFVLYKTDKETDWSELEAVRMVPLTYHAGFTANLDGNYEFRIIDGHSSGASAQLNTRELRKDLYDEFYVRRTTMSSSGRSEDREAFKFDFSLQNNTFGLEDYLIESITAKILYEGTVIFDQDVTQWNQGDPEEIARKNLQIASGQKLEKVPKAPSEQDPNIQKMSYQIELIKEDLLKNFPDLLPLGSNGFLDKKDTGNDFEIEVLVVYHNGEEKRLGM